MEENTIRRVPVVEAGGSCCGIVALADTALYVSKNVAAEVVKEVSELLRQPRPLFYSMQAETQRRMT